MKKLTLIFVLTYCLLLFAACDATHEADNSTTDVSSSVSEPEGSSSSTATSSKISVSSSTSTIKPPSSSSSTTNGTNSQTQTKPQSQPVPRQTPSSPTPAANSTTVPAASPVEQTPDPVATPEPTPAPQSTPAPTPAPVEPTPQPTPQPEQPKGAYDYPFDVAQIQSDMVAWGQAAGMAHEAGARNPDTSSWDNPITASESFQGDILRSKLQEYVQFYTFGTWAAYGNEPVTNFTIYVSGTTFYVLH